MGKKGGKSSGNVSNGIHSNVNRQILNKMRRDYIASGDRMFNQRSAWAAGKNVVLTIENTNKHETAKKYIKVNAKDLWGSPKYRT